MARRPCMAGEAAAVMTPLGLKMWTSFTRALSRTPERKNWMAWPLPWVIIELRFADTELAMTRPRSRASPSTSRRAARPAMSAVPPSARAPTASTPRRNRSRRLRMRRRDRGREAAAGPGPVKPSCPARSASSASGCTRECLSSGR